VSPDEPAAPAGARDAGPPEPDLSWLGAGVAEDAIRIETLAPIWATVELERALLDLDQPIERAASAVVDPLLGARVAVMDLADARAPDRLALAEPSTEGRLAAALARHGERPAGRYVAVSRSLAAIARLAAAAGVPLSRPAVGPFGREVLVLDGAPGGPFLILVEAPAVPSRP
jgi:hypothetical protein